MAPAKPLVLPELGPDRAPYQAVFGRFWAASDDHSIPSSSSDPKKFPSSSPLRPPFIGRCISSPTNRRAPRPPFGTFFPPALFLLFLFPPLLPTSFYSPPPLVGDFYQTTTKQPSSISPSLPPYLFLQVYTLAHPGFTSHNTPALFLRPLLLHSSYFLLV